MRNATILLAVLAMVATAVQADMTIYEPFDYDAGAIAGEGGSETGLTGTWAQQTGSTTIATGNLNSGAIFFDPVGNRISETAGGIAERAIATEAQMPCNASHTYYASALIRRVGPNASGDDSVMIRFVQASGPYVRWKFGIGHRSAAGDAFLVGMSGGMYGNAPDFDKTYFIVSKMVATSGEDTVYLKVYGPDDSVPDIEPVTWDITHSETTGVTLDEMWVDVADGTNGGQIDEIRVGTTWGDVVVPEPATMVLLGLGGMGVLLRRKHR